MGRRWLLPTALLALALLGASVLFVWGERIAAQVHPEVFKVLAQLVILAGLGGVSSLILNEFHRARERREQRRERQRGALSDLITSYNKIKGLRRRLRAEAIRPNFSDPAAVVSGKEYGTLLRCLNEAQLNIETYIRLIEGNQDLYAYPENLIKHLKEAENYLGKLVTEWEDNLGKFQGAPLQPLANLQVLRCFVNDASMSFKPSFSAPMGEVLRILGRAIER